MIVATQKELTSLLVCCRQWNTANLVDATGMFRNADMLDSSKIQNWDVSSLTKASYMFHGNLGTTANLCSWGNMYNNPDHYVRLTTATNVTLATFCRSTVRMGVSIWHRSYRRYFFSGATAGLLWCSARSRTVVPRSHYLLRWLCGQVP